MTKSNAWVFGGFLVAIVVLAAGIIALDRDSETVQTTPTPPASAERIQIAHGVLSVESTFEATAVREEQNDVTVSSSGEETTSVSVVTATPITAKETAPYGSVVIEVNYRPVILLNGSIPLIRDLGPGDTGKDVSQLQAVLTVQGYGIQDQSGTFGPSTSQAVSNLYEDRGYTAPNRTSEDLDPAKDALAEAQNIVAQQETALVEAERLYTQATQQPQDEAAASVAGVDELAAIETAKTELARANDLAAKAAEEVKIIEASTGPYLPQSEVIFMTTSAPVVETINYTEGDVVDPENPVAATVVGNVAAFEVPLGNGSELTPDSPVTITVGDETFDGQVQNVEERDLGPDSGRSWFADVTTTDPIPSETIGTAVITVEAVGETTTKPVYNVPIEALTTDGTGAPAIWLAAGDTVTITPVVTGLVANGSVEVRSETIELSTDGYVLTR